MARNGSTAERPPDSDGWGRLRPGRANQGTSLSRMPFASELLEEAQAVRARPRRGAADRTALVSYLVEPVLPRRLPHRFRGHSNRWECRELVAELCRIGYEVDVIDFDRPEKLPRDHYDLVLALDSELLEIAERTSPDILLSHLTGASPQYNNEAELERLDQLELRRGVRLPPHRLAADPESTLDAYGAADHCSLIGNSWTRSTYPADIAAKAHEIPVTGSVAHIKQSAHLVPDEREFVWFFGAGAVHKGLDLVLEAFSGLPEARLHVIGNIQGETEFMTEYRKELFETPNIRFHGMLDPAGKEFRRIADRSVAFVAPTCSEGTSTACVTMLQVGLLPVLTVQAGVDLDEGVGIMLTKASADEIRESVIAVNRATQEALRMEIATTQALALDRHSRASFSRSIGSYLRRVTG